MRVDGKIDYIEFPGQDLPATKDFYEHAFGWTFTDYGPKYAAFDNGGVDGGFDSDGANFAAAPLVVLLATDLEAMMARVTGAGGVITRPIFSFPGGRRFHFTDPSGNQLAVFNEN